ncbi:MAG: hypothetical protein IJT25_02645, partial [Clostridia bacterium]|nr:hypothetical protein [Clostridia bacterium]
SPYPNAMNPNMQNAPGISTNENNLQGKILKSNSATKNNAKNIHTETDFETKQNEELIEQERLKEQTINFFASRTWVRKPKQQADNNENVEDDDLDFENYIERLSSELDNSEQNKEEKPETDETDEVVSEEEIEPTTEEIDAEEENNSDDADIDEQAEDNKESESNEENIGINEESSNEKPIEENPNKEDNKEDTKEESAVSGEPKVISKLDYFKYRFIDNSAVGAGGKAKVEALATRYGAKREEGTNAGFIASKTGKADKQDNINTFNNEEINLDFSKKGSAKVYKSSKALSVASIIFAILYAIGGVIAYMMLGVPVITNQKAVAMTINVADSYVKFVEIGEMVSLDAYTLTLTLDDGTTKQIKANRELVSSWPNCVDSETMVATQLASNANIRLSYDGALYKNLKITTYKYVIESVKYTIIDGTSLFNEDLSNVLVVVKFVAKTVDSNGDEQNLKINGQDVVKLQQIKVNSTKPNTNGYVVTNGTNTISSIDLDDYGTVTNITAY